MGSLVESILTTRPIEDLFGWAARNRKGHDTGLITRSSQLSSAPEEITVACPEIGPSGTSMPKPYASSSVGGSNLIPSLSWSTTPELKPRVKAWVLTCEDPDAPLAEPIIHGIYYGVAATKTSTSPEDFEISGDRRLKGGFWYGQNRAGSVYVAPRPIVGHGPHRYFWSVLALGEDVDWETIRKDAGSEGLGKAALIKAVDGKVLARGEWIGVYERQ